MTTGKFIEYLHDQSFPRLNFLSISAPVFMDEFQDMDPTSLPDHDDGIAKRHVTLQLESIDFYGSAPLLYALSYVPFAFTTIHIHSSPWLASCEFFPSFLDRTKKAVTEIRIDGESPLHHTGHTTLCGLTVTCFSADHWVQLTKFDSVKRVELFDFNIKQVNILERINATTLEDLLITTNQKCMDWDWGRLDSALVALWLSSGSNYLKFYLTSDDGEFELEGQAHTLLPLFTNLAKVRIDKSLVGKSMGWHL